MLVFAAAFNPQILVNLLKAAAACPGNAWRSRKALLHGLCCWPCLLGREIRELARGMSARAARVRSAVQMRERQHVMRPQSCRQAYYAGLLQGVLCSARLFCIYHLPVVNVSLGHAGAPGAEKFDGLRADARPDGAR